MLRENAVPFLVMIAVGIIALMLSVFLRSLVERRMDLARRESEIANGHDDSDASSGEVRRHSFWLRYGEAVKRSIQSLAWMFFGLGALNFVSFGLLELSDTFKSNKDLRFPGGVAEELQKISLWIKQGADVLLKIAVIAVAGIWIARFFQSAMRGLVNGDVASRALHASPRMKIRSETLLNTSGYVVNIFVFVVCFLMSLQILGVTLAPLLATAGVASVAIGFGAQTMVRDLLAGFFILLEDQFAVGDVVTIDAKSGTVEKLTLRSTKLRLSDGSLLVIPNGEIKKIENATSGFSQVDFKIAVLYGSQIDKANAIVVEQMQLMVAEHHKDILASPEFLGIDSVKDSAVFLKARVKTVAGRQYALERELNLRVLRRFIEEEIALPAVK
jgi:small conductance mechanosensitive channel